MLKSLGYSTSKKIKKLILKMELATGLNIDLEFTQVIGWAFSPFEEKMYFWTYMNSTHKNFLI